MPRMKAFFAALVLVTAIPTLAPNAFAATKGVVIAAGSSALWQTMALAAYNAGNCPVPKAGLVCHHYTNYIDNSVDPPLDVQFELHDSRTGKKLKGSQDGIDKGDIWIVWDNTSGPNVWAYIRVDSVVGNRCFFANPACNIQTPAAYNWGSTGQRIPAALWGADTANPPANVQALFPITGSANGGVKVNTAGTDIRPEDAAWAECRVNSKLGAGSPGFGDGLDGLGYNGFEGSGNAPGTCPQYSTANNFSQLVGNLIRSGYPGSTTTATPLAFNLSGQDPFTNSTVQNYTVVDVGASPVTFIYSRNGGSGTGLDQGAGITGLSVTADQLQDLFSGTNCDAANFGVGNSPNPIYAYLMTPLSGEGNTVEATLFRRTVQTIASNGITVQGNGSGHKSLSQETGVGTNNPLKVLPCGTAGFRSRAVDAGEEVRSVQNSQFNNGVDGIAYTFFSFGNMVPLAGNAGYAYLKVDGIDPVGPFNANTEKLYPNQELVACVAPCTENQFWNQVNGQSYSFPNVRNGTYSAWSMQRMVASTASKIGVQDLVNVSQAYVVNSTPDYVPAVGIPLRCVGAACTDPGLQIFRAHYQQCNGNGTSATCPGADAIGPAPSAGTFNTNNNPTGGDTGGDMGGCIGSTIGGFSVANGVIQVGIDKDVNGTQGTSGVSCSNGADRH